jgi:hypothetical protein
MTSWNEADEVQKSMWVMEALCPHANTKRAYVIENIDGVRKMWSVPLQNTELPTPEEASTAEMLAAIEQDKTISWMQPVFEAWEKEQGNHQS